MCGGKIVKKIFGGGSSSQPKVQTYAPAATVMNSDVADGSANAQANEKERRKRGFNSTRNIGNILGGVGTQKNTLG